MILDWWNGAGVFVIVRTIRIVRLVEVDGGFGFQRLFGQIEIPSAAVRFNAVGEVFERTKKMIWVGFAYAGIHALIYGELPDRVIQLKSHHTIYLING